MYPHANRNLYRVIAFIFFGSVLTQAYGATPTTPSPVEAPLLAPSPNDATSATVAPNPPAASSTTSTTPPTSTPTPTPTPNTLYPSGLTPVNIGPLELAPSKSVVVLYREKENTCFNSTIRFKVRNTSAADVKVVLLDGLEVIDDLGNELFERGQYYPNGNIKASGIPTADIEENNLVKYFEDNKLGLTVISPKQSIDVQLVTFDKDHPPCQADKTAEVYKILKPKTFNLSGQIGILDAEDKPQIRGFSFSEVPFEFLKK